MPGFPRACSSAQERLEGTFSGRHREVQVPIGNAGETAIPGYNRRFTMRWRCLIFALGALSAAACAADESQSLLTLPCAQAASSSTCEPYRADVKKAKSAFSRAIKLEKARRMDEAYAQFDAAARLVPKNPDYITSLAMTRERVVYEHLQRGNQYLLDSKEIEAQAEFRSALNLDPQNEFAKQRLNESLSEWAPKPNQDVQIVQNSGELHVIPNDVRQEFHFRGDSYSLLLQVAA